MMDATLKTAVPESQTTKALADAATAPEVSAVIPCLNEVRSISACVDKAVEAFRNAGIRGEVVVADNGSTDGSQDVAAEHGARVIHVEIKGYGSALRSGIAAARGAFIIIGDADGSHDFSEIPRFVEKWRAGHDFVIGNRFMGEIKEGAMSWHHHHLFRGAVRSRGISRQRLRRAPFEKGRDLQADSA
jgi:glycosyltransferase involved in cell wall biosynthesis